MASTQPPVTCPLWSNEKPSTKPLTTSSAASKSSFETRACGHDAISAAIAANLDDPYQIQRIARAFTAQIHSDHWLDILHAHARCKRIVRDLSEHYDLNPDRDPEEASRALHKAYLAARKTMDTADDKLTALIQTMAELRDPINRFFEDVLINGR